MEEQEITESSTSPWALPIAFVCKKDGSPRFCVEYSKLNSIFTKDCYLLPRVYDILDSLSGAQQFSTLDLCSGHWQVAVNPTDWEKTSVMTLYGLHQFV